MAITRYNEGYETSTGSTNPRTFPIDVGSGSDRVLVVFSLFFNGTGGDILSGMTYGGVAMTKVSASDNITNAFYTSMWILINPASGTNTLSASFSSTPQGSWFTYASYDGCDQTTQPDADDVIQGNTSTVTANLTTVTDGAFFLGFGAGNRVVSPGTNMTQVVKSGNGTGFLGEYTSNPVATAGAVSMDFNAISGAHNGYHWLALKPAGGGGVTPPQFLGFAGL